MKLTLVILLPCLISAKPFGLPEVHVKETKSANGIPAIDITFPDGFQDQLVLERHYMTNMDRMAQKMHCNFIGHLAIDAEACVAVTGCPGERMEFTVNSKHAGRSNRFILHQNGEMEKVESAFKGMESFTESLKIPQQMRDNEQWELVDGDEMMNAAQFADEMAWEQSCAAGQCTALPETNLMNVKVGYDDTFNADLGSATAAAAYLDSMFTHVQTFFCHPTLGSKIQIERDGDYTYHSGNTWKAEPAFGSLDGPIMSITSGSSSNAHLFVYMCKDPAFYGTIGLAWVGTLCGPNSWKGYKASINEKRESAVSTAEVVAHEMGHNMGMSHDFADVHGGNGSPCNGQGLMSYGSVPQKWSSCSTADYLARYNQVGGNNWCMSAAPSACGSTSSPPSPPGPTTAAPPPSGCGSPQWQGDGWCDDENNNAGCTFDGGDCCGDDVKTFYCSACECLDPNFTTTTLPPSTCEFPQWEGDGWCDDGNNNAGCSYDGGDCCGNNVKKNFCKTCECLDPNFVESTGCEYPQWEGDGWCDDGNNNADCTFDGGDCCGDDVKETFCSACECLQ